MLLHTLIERHGHDSFRQTHQWSYENPGEFWSEAWDDLGIVGTRGSIAHSGAGFGSTRWFPEASLNVVSTLLAGDPDTEVLVAYSEDGPRRSLTRAALRDEVAACAAALQASGVGVGDRVAAWMPHVPETVIFALGALSLGAIVSTASTDFGPSALVDRFGQIEPTILLASARSMYGGKSINHEAVLDEVADRLPTLTTVVVVGGDSSRTSWESWLGPHRGAALSPRDLPFDHPGFILFSSGTTGTPKCIVHSAAGVLLKVLSEQGYHLDVRAGDRMLYATTCGWMMWNWLVAGLATEASIVLFDGSPFYPEPRSLIDMAEQEKINIFGTSAKYIAALEKAHVVPRESHQLASLKAILSTGSPLSHESFQYVYRDIKADLCLSSISGGTDILSCFVLGNPTLPVWEGQIQCRGLGMAVEIWDEQGRSVTEQKGELVCVKPFPSAPIYFWNDPENKKYLSAYFQTYANIWAHGDYGEITAQNGVIIHGRSDAVLNPGGVRIGTAEIYRQVEKLDEVVDSICIGQDWDDDVRVVLFVVLRQGLSLDDKLIGKIRSNIRSETTPRHVPAKVIAVTDIPRTISGKIVELAVRKVVHGQAVNNTDALANPEALELFKDLPELEN